MVLTLQKKSTPSEVLYAEIDWLKAAHANSGNKGFYESYRDGFASAIGWMEFHAKQAKAMEKE